MEVTEHNLTDWKLSESELTDIISLVKQKMRDSKDNSAQEMYYGIILGKLIILRNETT